VVFDQTYAVMWGYSGQGSSASGTHASSGLEHNEDLPMQSSSSSWCTNPCAQVQTVAVNPVHSVVLASRPHTCPGKAEVIQGPGGSGSNQN
jgi:hypothetical protein